MHLVASFVFLCLDNGQGKQKQGLKETSDVCHIPGIPHVLIVTFSLFFSFYIYFLRFSAHLLCKCLLKQLNSLKS